MAFLENLTRNLTKKRTLPSEEEDNSASGMDYSASSPGEAIGGPRQAPILPNLAPESAAPLIGSAGGSGIGSQQPLEAGQQRSGAAKPPLQSEVGPPAGEVEASPEPSSFPRPGYGPAGSPSTANDPRNIQNALRPPTVPLPVSTPSAPAGTPSGLTRQPLPEGDTPGKVKRTFGNTMAGIGRGALMGLAQGGVGGAIAGAIGGGVAPSRAYDLMQEGERAKKQAEEGRAVGLEREKLTNEKMRGDIDMEPRLREAQAQRYEAQANAAYQSAINAADKLKQQGEYQKSELARHAAELDLKKSEAEVARLRGAKTLEQGDKKIAQGEEKIAEDKRHNQATEGIGKQNADAHTTTADAAQQRADAAGKAAPKGYVVNEDWNKAFKEEQERAKANAVTTKTQLSDAEINGLAEKRANRRVKQRYLKGGVEGQSAGRTSNGAATIGDEAFRK